MINDNLDIAPRKTMTIEELKYLDELHEEFFDTNNKFENIDYNNVHSIDYTDKVSSAPNNHQLEDYAVKIAERKMELHLACLEILHEIMVKCDLATTIISTIPSYKQQELLMARYIEHKSIKEVCKELDISKSSYFKLHQRALKSFLDVQINTNN